MIRITILMAIFFMAIPAYAQDASGKVQNKTQAIKEALQNHDGHVHKEHDHKHEMRDSGHGGQQDHAVISETPEIIAALSGGGEPVVVDVLGVVCDFCAKAMNKTFARREEVAVTYVDLDQKTLSLVFRPGETLDDDTIGKLIKKAGYRTAGIRRGEAALMGDMVRHDGKEQGDEADPS